MERVNRVREYRLSSDRKSTVAAAKYPNKFGLEVIPNSDYLNIPVVSSEKREYIPIGFMHPNVLCSNQVNLVPNATLYHFGVLTSSVHMAWMRAVAGRLKSDYRYSKDIVYNNYIWPEVTDDQKEKISKTAQAILDARKIHQNVALGKQYGENMHIFSELYEAHQINDRAVIAAYGWDKDITDEEIVKI